MSLNAALRQTHAFLGGTAKIYGLVDENRLAQLARSQELMHGSIVAPHPVAMSSYLPYHAARPVAAHTGGLRRAGFGASAAWGASLAVGGMRTDLPLLSLYWLTFHQNYRQHPAPPRCPAPSRDGQQSKAAHAFELAKVVLKAAPYAAFALAGWEAALGTGQLAGEADPAAVDARVGARRWRRIGGAGRLEAAVVGAAGAAAEDGRAGAELAWLGLAVGVRLTLVPLRMAGALFVGSIALLGAVFGIGAEAVAQVVFYGYLAGCRACGSAPEVLSMQAAIARQYPDQAEQLRALDDTVLGAPLIDALWRQAPDEGLQENNRWTSVGVAAATLHRHARLQQLGLFPQAYEMRRAERALGALARALRPNEPGAAPGADAAAAGAARAGYAGAAHAPEAARFAGPEAARYAEGVDVHERGRDPATRRSLHALMARYPQVAEQAAIAALRAELTRQRRAGTPLARRLHEAGGPLLAAAERALDPAVERGDFQPFPAVLDPNNTIRLDDGRDVSLRHVCALVWHAIEQLEDSRGEAGYNEALRQERKEALLAALADCITGTGIRVCGPGQAQRIVLVLQGCVEEVQVENYEEAPNVAQIVTYLYGQIMADLPDEPTHAQVQARYDAAFRDGRVRLPAAQHARLRRDLARMAQVDYDYAWAPAV